MRDSVSTTPTNRLVQEHLCLQDDRPEDMLEATVPTEHADRPARRELVGPALPSPCPQVLVPWERLSELHLERQVRLDAWVVPPHTQSRRTHGRGRGQKGRTMTQPLVDLVEQFCQYQLK
jgi:hypothetical protein